MTDKLDRRTAIATRLRVAREQAGLSQGQAARALGLARPAISEAEAGRRRVAADELVEFARIFGVSVAWLACEDTGEADADRDRVQLAARKLANLKPQDLTNLLNLLSSLRRGEDVSR